MRTSILWHRAVGPLECNCYFVGDPVSSRPALLDTRKELAAPGVEAQELVEILGGATAGEGGASRAGILADALQVEQGSGAYPSSPPGTGGSSTSVPECASTKRATASASSPTTMFCGMIAPEKPPFRIA